MSLPEDTWTTTEDGAAAWERLRGRDAWIDNRPTEAELAEQDFDDWRWWREHTADRPDPWGCEPVRIERVHAPIPDEPPF
jgi:hypothetical protein